jgi:hypothetical protein
MGAFGYFNGLETVLDHPRWDREFLFSEEKIIFSGCRVPEGLKTAKSPGPPVTDFGNLKRS